MISNYLMGNGILYNKTQTDNKLNLQAMASKNNQIEELKQLIQDQEVWGSNPYECTLRKPLILRSYVFFMFLKFGEISFRKGENT